MFRIYKVNLFSGVAFCVATCHALSGHAKVFDFNKQWLASYLKGQAGVSQLGKDAFAEASGSATNFSESVNYNYSGQAGFIFLLTPKFGVHLGYELMRPQTLSLIEGNNGRGKKLLDLESKVLGMGPVFGVSYYFRQRSSYRLFSSLSMSLLEISLDNKYLLTDLGRSTYSVQDYTEKSTASGYSTTLGFGIEFLFSDQATAALNLGYRHFPIDRLKYKHSVTTIGGARQGGDEVVNDSGDPRKLDLSEFFTGLAFNFYL